MTVQGSVELGRVTGLGDGQRKEGPDRGFGNCQDMRMTLPLVAHLGGGPDDVGRENPAWHRGPILHSWLIASHRDKVGCSVTHTCKPSTQKGEAGGLKV